MRLVLCPACTRHVYEDEAACPFCGGLLDGVPPRELAALPLNLTRAAVVFMGASALAGCGKERVTPPPPDALPVVQPVQGAPQPMPMPVAIPPYGVAPIDEPRPAPPPRPAPHPEEPEPGFVTVSAYPWAKVSEGGRVVCPATPCSKISMSPGRHTLTFENPETGQKQTVTIQIKSGETTSKAIQLK